MNPKTKTDKPKESITGNINTELIRDTLVNFIVPLISFGIIFLQGLFIIYPSYKKLPELRKTLKQNTTKKEVLTAKLKKLNNLVDFKSVVDENSLLVTRVLGSKSAVPELLNQVDQLAHEAGFTVQKLSYSHGSSKKDDTSTMSNVDVSLSVMGTYAQAVSFLKNTENSARMVNVDTLRYSASRTADNPDALTINFALEAPYMYVQSNAVTDDPLKLDITSKEFIDFMNKLKSLRYFSATQPNNPVVEHALEQGPSPAEETEVDATETPETTPSAETE